jgi:hypothetical protein
LGPTSSIFSDYPDLPRIINEFSEKMDEVGPNPYKGF